MAENRELLNAEPPIVLKRQSWISVMATGHFLLALTCNSVCCLQMFTSTNETNAFKPAHFCNQTQNKPCFPSTNFQMNIIETLVPPRPLKIIIHLCKCSPPSSLLLSYWHRRLKRCGVPFFLRRPWRLSLTPSCLSLHRQESSGFECRRSPFFIAAETKVMPLYC